LRRNKKAGDRTEQALRALRKSGGFVSGSELGRALGITRAALWKRINSLRQKGYTIEAQRGKGYRLVKSPDLSAEELKACVRGGLGREVVFLDSVESTNDRAMELALRGSPHGTVVVADAQTKGKGRLGRKWASPPGRNLYMSVVLRPGIPPRDAALLTLMSSVACVTALKERTGLEAKIKWPNDLVVSAEEAKEPLKLGGILLEMKSEQDRITHCVAGIGINVNSKKADFPSQVRSIATSVYELTGRRTGRAKLAAAILDALAQELKSLGKEGRGPLLQRWRWMSATLGRRVKVTVGKETITGIAHNIDEDGSLLLETPEGTRKMSTGDLTMLR
jgi:BirA family biotin operon repressor/biotin-[acetyl-CoA-carboxylase] ligase